MHRKAVHVSDRTKARRAAYQAAQREIDDTPQWDAQADINEAIREFNRENP